MKKISFAVSLIAVLATAGCMTTPQPRSSTNSNTTATTNADPVASATVFAVNEDAAAGSIIHKVTSVETLDSIPKSYTLADWQVIAEDLPADEGFQWVHIKGTVTNNSKQTQTVTSSSLYVMDAADNEYDVSTDTTIYVPEDASPVYLNLQPTQNRDWEGYFMVPTTAKGLVLVGDDLSFAPKDVIKVDLGL